MLTLSITKSNARATVVTRILLQNNVRMRWGGSLKIQETRGRTSRGQNWSGEAGPTCQHANKQTVSDKVGNNFPEVGSV